MENKDKYSVGDYVRVNTDKFYVGRESLRVKEGSIIQVLDVCESDGEGVWIDTVSCSVMDLNDWVDNIDPNDFSLVEDFLKSEEHVAIAEGSKEAVDEALGIDMVQSPPHYNLFHKDDIEGDFIEVKHVVKAVLERWEQQENISFDFYQAGCYKELLQYLLRAPLKNNIEDVQKAGYYLKEVIDEW